MEIKLIEEFRIKRMEHEPLQSLLSDAFPGFLDNRIYFKQLPTFRLIAKENGQIIGQTGIVHRAIGLGGISANIFGIVDLAVAKKFRKHGIGKSLLVEKEFL